MKLVVDIPEWAWRTGKIRIFADYELVAELTKTVDGWMLKTKSGRCKTKLGIPCGVCCEKAKCPDLKCGVCNAERGVPFRCLSSVPRGLKGCTEQFEEVSL